MGGVQDKINQENYLIFKMAHFQWPVACFDSRRFSYMVGYCPRSCWIMDIDAR